MEQIITKVSKNEIYDTVKKWWVERNFPIIPYHWLPETAYVFTEGDHDMAIVFIYTTDSCILWTAYPSTNPIITKDQGDYALLKLNQIISDDNENSVVFTTTSNSKIEKSLIKAGYQIGDQNVNQYVKINNNGSSLRDIRSRSRDLPNSIRE